MHANTKKESLTVLTKNEINSISGGFSLRQEIKNTRKEARKIVNEVKEGWREGGEDNKL